MKTKYNNQSLKGKSILTLFMIFVATLVMVFPIASVFADQGIESLRNTGKAFASVARKVSPAVVFIQVEKTVNNKAVIDFFSPFGNGGGLNGDDLLRRFFGMPFEQQYPNRNQNGHTQRTIGQGSGFILSSDGYIITNNHVVGDADKVIVQLEDGRQFQAKTIGTDPHSDVAVIKIDADDLPHLSLGNSDDLEVGEWVIAIGNPFGLSHTLTAGIVSAIGRSSLGLTDYENFIQTDAAINPGNSGGPLVNLDSKVIGMNTAIVSSNGGYIGIGFAIPINMVKNIADQLIHNGSVTRGYLGMVIQELTPNLAQTFGIKEGHGILVSQVTSDSPADRAGFKQGDVITEIDRKPVEGVGPFRNHIALTLPGTKTDFLVIRDGQPRNITVTIGKLTDDISGVGNQSGTTSHLGLTVHNLTSDLAKRFDLQTEKGVVITNVENGSVADIAGLKPGMVIEEVNHTEVNNINEFKQAIEKNNSHGNVLLLINDGQYSFFVVLDTE